MKNTKHRQSHDSKNTIKVKQPILSSSLSDCQTQEDPKNYITKQGPAQW